MITNKVKGLLVNALEIAGKFSLSDRGENERESCLKENGIGVQISRVLLCSSSELVDSLIPIRTIRAIRGKGCPDENWKCFFLTCQLEGLPVVVHVLDIRLGLKATLCYYMLQCSSEQNGICYNILTLNKTLILVLVIFSDFRQDFF